MSEKQKQKERWQRDEDIAISEHMARDHKRIEYLRKQAIRQLEIDREED